jgi:hypothetical protein
MLAELAARAEKLLIGAYDGESVLVWSRHVGGDAAPLDPPGARIASLGHDKAWTVRAVNGCSAASRRSTIDARGAGAELERWCELTAAGTSKG